MDRRAHEQRHTSAQWLGLDAEVDLDAKLLLGLLQHRHHDLWSVVDGEDDIGDSSLGCKCRFVLVHRSELTLTNASIWCKLSVSGPYELTACPK